MSRLNLRLLAAAGILLLAAATQAQDTNVLKTGLENFEAQTGVVIVRGAGLVGEVHAGSGVVSVITKESQNFRSGQKQYGIAIGVTKVPNALEDSTVVDYDELDNLINGIEFVSKANHSVTSLPSFDAGFTTRGGLRVFAYTSIREQGGVQAAVQGPHMANARLLLTPAQLAQFTDLVKQAKAQLDKLRTAK